MYYNSINKCYIRHTIETIGKNTLGIYVIQYIIIEMNILNLPFYIICRNSFLCCFGSIIIVLVINKLVSCIRKYKKISILLIGS